MYSPTKIRINIESPSHFRKKKRKMNEKQPLLNKKQSHTHHAMRKPTNKRNSIAIAYRLWDDEEGNEIVMPFVSEDGWLRHDSLQTPYYPLQPVPDSRHRLRPASSMPRHHPEHCNDQSSAAHSHPVLSLH